MNCRGHFETSSTDRTNFYEIKKLVNYANKFEFYTNAQSLHLYSTQSNSAVPSDTFNGYEINISEYLEYSRQNSIHFSKNVFFFFNNLFLRFAFHFQ